MVEQRILDCLRGLRFAADLSEEDLNKLTAISSWAKFPAQATVFSEGSQTDNLFLIVSGRVELSMSVPEQGRLPILTLEKGDLLGGSPALGQSEMTMTAATLLETEAIQIDATALRALCESDHDIGYEIMRRVASALMSRLVATRLQVLDVHRDSLSSQAQSSSENVQ